MLTKSRSQVAAAGELPSLLAQAMEEGDGLLRLTPNWVPRVFCKPGRRIKLAQTDWYALGLDRGGIDERWFASTTEADNVGRTEDEGLSYIRVAGKRFLLRDAVTEGKGAIVGDAMWEKYNRWPVFSKFFDNLGPLPHHMHQMEKDAKLTGQDGKPEAYYYPPQLNAAENRFDYTFMGLEPGTTKKQVRKCLEDWNKGDNGILDLSRAYRLKPGTGWVVPAGVLHAPGSVCTYEPQWGSDVFGMFQSLTDHDAISWDLLVKNVPDDKKFDLDFIVDQLDWEKNVDPLFKEHNYLEPIIDEEKSAPNGDYVDKWIVYGLIDGEQKVTAKELTVMPGCKCLLKDGAASAWITTQGRGTMGKLNIESPNMIYYGEEPDDEVFITATAGKEGVEIVNTGSEPLVGLRYFGPDSHKSMPMIGDYKKYLDI
ncbi:MAG: hypothetical protein II561_12050 [Thermoguttaceae bacterium]|nr:hypothetical protein [Thermoguttaceae bacterium]MBQ2038445.1 hypothetical protein [Thermoguttaceae bacterium]MBQ2557270.1 hypothetical protein [Thermoguttaceae bacterium]MBQ4202943.1 hypothetical protein [Thermoguttaceae bacterium]MBQ5368517.1 hypothetical protein [Thermoguttaceae bacterium]